MSAPYPFPYKSVACTFLLLWVFVFLSADLFAGSFRTLGIKEGLGSRQVFQINKDSAGFVWVYTHVGIDRYDGCKVTTAKLSPLQIIQTDSTPRIFTQPLRMTLILTRRIPNKSFLLGTSWISHV